MEGDGNGVEVTVESSWNVLQGSLDKCVTVVFLDPQTKDPIISPSRRASEKLVLVPPTERLPCEITVKFQGRLCHVQSIYTLSTARICELYSQSKPESDRDYICTVKGLIPDENSCVSYEGTEMVLEAVDVMHKNGMQETDFIEDTVGESVLSSVCSPTVAFNPSVDVDLEKSVYSSSDDSWVDVKFNGFFNSENACVTSLECNHWRVPSYEDQSVLGRPKSEARDTGIEGDGKLDGCSEGKVQIKEHIVQGNAQQDMFEAELELVDHSPWSTFTIRLLSLQDKSLVEVDQMVLLAVSGPVPEPENPSQSGGKGTDSLFAMFLPSMVKMVRGVSDNSNSTLKCEDSCRSLEQEQDMIDNLPAENLSQPCELIQDMGDKIPGRRKKIGIKSLQNAAEEVDQDIRDSAAHVHTNAAHVSFKAGSLEGDQEILQTSSANKSGPKITVEMGQQPFQSDSDVMPRCNCKVLAGDLMAMDLVSTLEAFSERFDKLESLCLRMEAYLQKAFENLDQRLTHLEVQNRKGSKETDCVSAPLRQSGVPVDASIMQIRHNNEESPPSSMQHADLTDFLPSSNCKEGASISLTQSVEDGYSKEHDVFNEVPKLILFDDVNSNLESAEKPVLEAPAEGRELPKEPATMVGSTSMQSRKHCVSLDVAWASALSAFASSFTPVIEVENTGADQVDEQPSGSSQDASISTSQECEKLRKETESSEEIFHCDVDFAANVPHDLNHKDANSESVNPEDGLIYKDCTQVPCDELLPRQNASPTGISLEKPDSSLFTHSSNTCTSVLNDGFDILGLKEMQIKDRAGVNHSCEDTNFPTMQGPPIPSQDGVSACPLFDVFTFGHSNSMFQRELNDNSPAVTGFNTRLSPVFDSTSAETQDADFFSVGNEEPEVHLSTPSNNFSPYQEKMDLGYFEGNKQEYMYGFDDKALSSISDRVRFQSEFSLFNGASNPWQTEENKEEIFCNTRASSTVDCLGDSLSRVKGKVTDMSEIQDPKSFKITSFMNCETEAATGSPDVLEEECSNYQDGRACSEDSLCFSQDFDTCQNEPCEDEWSCAPNVFYLNDLELTDDETNVGVAEVEKIEVCDISDTESTECLPFWPALHNEKIDQQ